MASFKADGNLRPPLCCLPCLATGPLGHPAQVQGAVGTRALACLAGALLAARSGLGILRPRARSRSDSGSFGHAASSSAVKVEMRQAEKEVLKETFSSVVTTKEFVLSRSWPAERTLPVDEFIKMQQTWLVNDRLPVMFDVRAPCEFEQGHFPGALNLPLLSDTERAGVGTLFKQVGRDQALDLALGCVHPNLLALLEQAQALADKADGQGEYQDGGSSSSTCPRRHALVYCKRGGMRSQSVAAFLSHHGFTTYTMQEGYKGFRNWAEEMLARPQRVCVLGGATGAGKTDVLTALAGPPHNLQVVDLEDLAKHKGSVFGHLGEDGPQPTSEHFRNLLALKWRRFDPEKFVFLEDEGARIGHVALPAVLYRRMRTAPLVIHLDAPFELRAERSLEVYGQYGAGALCPVVEQFRPRMGPKRTDELLELLKQGDLRPVCEAALKNYDKAYDQHLRRGRDPSCIVALPVHSFDIGSIAEEVQALAISREALAPLEPVELLQGEKASALATSTCASGTPTVISEADQASFNSKEAREARCFCGAVVVRVRGDPVSVSACHCSICRRLSGGPFVISALFKPENAEVLAAQGESAPALQSFQSSVQVTRQRCANCFSPIVGRLGERFIAVPLGSFDWGDERAPPGWSPMHHLHYDSRVIDVNDDLPKYRNRKQGPRWKSTIIGDTTEEATSC